MQFHLYNTLSRSKEAFKPIDPSLVKIYSCGPTVYSDPHIGNLRAFFFAGLLGDVIRHIAGYPVKHVMNVTDVGHLTDDGDAGEDKMEKGSRTEGLDARALAKKYENNFKKYIDQLHIHFDHIPRATDYIQEQIDIVQELEKNGYTYEIPDDGIYMDTSKIADYGKLLPKGHLEGIQSGARIDTEGKKNPTDFALWKFSPRDTKRQMEWESPRGVGFPGRHIECNAMSRAFLGDQFDIHTGGIDHIPVHHTDEIAQAECSYAHTKPRVKYRLHCQFLNIDNTKISKSLGNVLSLPQILDNGFTPEDLRYFFLQAHYRSFQDFTREALEAAKKSRQNLKKLFVPYLEGSPASGYQEDISYLTELLLDDLNTPQMLARLWAGADALDASLAAAIRWLDEHVLKLGLFEPESKQMQHIPQKIQDLASQRRQAKLAKDRAKADALRDELKSLGYEMKDGKDGYEVVKI